MVLKSHPNKQLKTHLKNIKNKSLEKLNELELNLNLINKKQLLSLIEIICICHDLGKACKSFQKYINNIGQNLKHESHSISSAYISYFIISKYCEKNNLNQVFSLICSNSIISHHGELHDIDDIFSFILSNDFERSNMFNQIDEILSNQEMILLIKNLCEKNDIDYEEVKINIYNSQPLTPLKIRLLLKNLNDEDKIEIFYLQKLIFSFLIDFDKKDAAEIINHKFIKKLLDENIVSDYIKKLEKQNVFDSNKPSNKLKNEFRNIVMNNYKCNSENNIFTITAPTGIGKTLCALDLGTKIQNNSNFYKKIIYVLPFTSIIDQNYDVLYDVLKFKIKDMEENSSNYIIKHHYISEQLIQRIGYDSKNYLDDLLIIKSWDSNLIVSTYIQLLYSLFSSKNSFLTKFHNIVNSIIILDEVQFIGDKYWNLIRDNFKVLSEKFGITFVLMTATQPLIFKNRESIELSNNKYFEDDLNKKRIKTKIIKENIHIDSFFNLIKKESKYNRYLFVLNTKKSALKLYQFFDKSSEFKNYQLFYLSTNLTPYDRRIKIENIKKISKDKNHKYVVISTQLIEAGVDISSDICYSDISTIDSLVQRAGRCNRYNEIKIGKFVIINSLIDDNNKRFIDYINKDRFILEKTEKVLNDNKISLKDSVDNFFELIKNSKDDSNLFNLLNNLKFRTISDEFKLIENKFVTYGLFIENKMNKYLLNEYKKILNSNKDVFDKLGLLKKIKKKLIEYSVDINEKQLKILNQLGYLKSLGKLYYIKELNSEKVYSSEIGLNIDECTSAYFI